MTHELHSPTENHLLAALPPAEYEQLRPALTRVELRRGEVLFESGAPLEHLYFPGAGLVALLHRTAEGANGEIAVIGNDGCVGIQVLLGGGTVPSRAVVQIEGLAWRTKPEPLLEQFRSGGALQRLLLRYVLTLVTQVSQTLVCNRHHTVEQQLCRWLLLCLDRLDSREIRMTQKLLSGMLGMRRAGIAQAANRLREAGLIGYERGCITVPDRAKLEAYGCECYGVVSREAQRLLPRAKALPSASRRARPTDPASSVR
jgi:CRP-like cAMP-binding protein